MNYGKSINSVSYENLRNRKKRLEKVIAVKRLALQAVQEKIAREVENEKK